MLPAPPTSLSIHSYREIVPYFLNNSYIVLFLKGTNDILWLEQNVHPKIRHMHDGSEYLQCT